MFPVSHVLKAALASRPGSDLAGRARDRKLAPHEYQGGAFAISNLGMFGIKKFDAVINPPQSTILAVGAGEKRPIVNGDKIEPKTVMSVTLSCDHRVVDGMLGGMFVKRVGDYLENWNVNREF